MSKSVNEMVAGGHRSKIEIAANSTVIVQFYDPIYYDMMSTNSAVFQLLEKRKEVAKIAFRQPGSEAAKHAEELFEELNTRLKELLGL